jgi:beta-glucanase (GH16 family)
LNTSRSFEQLYGYFEIRCKVPFGYGFWPAFWLMSKNSWPPEIDVFEILGREPNKLIMTNHFLDDNKKKLQNGMSLYGPDFSKDFHLFGLEWNPKELIWYLDNKKVFTSRVGVPNEPMYLIVNLSLGGSEFSGNVNESTPMPNSFQIDYIKVYK